MENKRCFLDSLIDIVLIGGIVYLASKGIDGWGWLILVLLLRN
jgi:hypothetical protein